MCIRPKSSASGACRTGPQRRRRRWKISGMRRPSSITTRRSSGTGTAPGIAAAGGTSTQRPGPSGATARGGVDADYKATGIDPMRVAAPLTNPLPYRGRVRGGPDWLAFAGNWMTEWERTGDTKWRDKIIAGMDSIAAMPFGFLTGPNQLYGYDPKTGKLYALEEQVGTYNLATIMGGGEVVFELNTLIDHAGWKKAWDQYCRLHTARRDVIERDQATGTEGADGQYARPGRLAGYLYSLTKNAAYAKKAWSGVRIPRVAGTPLKRSVGG